MARSIVRIRMVILAGIACLAVSALGCVSSTDLESLGSKLDEIEVEVLQLRKEAPSKAEVAELGEVVERQIGQLVESEARVGAELEVLSRLVEELRTKLDDTNFRITQLTQQIAATNQELQAVRNAAEVARAVPPPPQAPNPTDPQSLYDTAYNDYTRGNYDLAILSFLKYLEVSPDTELADNATYWIGECYYLQGKFQKAIEQFDQVLTGFDHSDRSPSALLKKGFAHIGLGQRGPGVVQLQRVICDYSGTDEAHLAGQRLQEMGIDVDC